MEKFREKTNLVFRMRFPKSYAVGIAAGVFLLVVALLIALYFYMQASLRD